MKKRKSLKFNENVSETENTDTSKVEKSAKDFYTVLCPQMSPIHFSLAEPVFRKLWSKIRSFIKSFGK
jgi:hypothetical protein